MIEVPFAFATCGFACRAGRYCPDVHGTRPGAAKSSSHQGDSACSFASRPSWRRYPGKNRREGFARSEPKVADEPGKSSRLTNRLTRRSPRLASFAIVATNSESTQDRFAKNRRLAGSAFSTPRGADLFGSIRPVARSVGRGSLLAHFVAAVKTRRNESPPKASI